MSSRRQFLVQSGAIAAAAAAVAATAGQRAEAQAPSSSVPLDLTTTSVAQITMVAKDAEKVARGFSEVFGPSWTFYEFRPANLQVGGKAVSGAPVFKLACGMAGGYAFKIVQPVSGESAYADFLKAHGEGFYSIGVVVGRGPFDQIIANLTKLGVQVEMQGDSGDGSKFVVLQTAEKLGTRVELVSAPAQEANPNLKQTGTFSPKAPAYFDMRLPVIGGGRRFTQIGLVVKNAEEVAKNWETLFGIKGWRFNPIPVSAANLRGHVYTEAELPSATVTQGGAYMGASQLELLAPVAQDPGGIHRKFLDRHWPGNGFQHLMISPGSGGKADTMKLLATKGIKPEWQATVHIRGMTGSGDYVDLEDKIGGFVLEYNG